MSGPTYDSAGWRRRVIGMPDLTPVRKLVLLALETFADYGDGSNARPGERALADMCGVTTRAVREALSSGRDLGLINRTELANPKLHKSDVYRMATTGTAVPVVAGDHRNRHDVITGTATTSSPEPPFRPPLQGPSQRPSEARGFENEPSPGESQPPGGGARAQASTANSNSISNRPDDPADEDADTFWADPDPVEPDDPADIDRQLIEELLAQNPRPVAEDLRRRIDKLRASEEYNDRDISGGLWKWHNRPDAGPGLLPNLVGDAWKENRAADAARAQVAADRAATTAAESTRKAIANCTDCDDYGRLEDLTDCPRHPNFRQFRVS